MKFVSLSPSQKHQSQVNETVVCCIVFVLCYKYYQLAYITLLVSYQKMSEVMLEIFGYNALSTHHKRFLCRYY